jgi:hypothetical protein
MLRCAAFIGKRSRVITTSQKCRVRLSNLLAVEAYPAFPNKLSDGGTGPVPLWNFPSRTLSGAGGGNVRNGSYPSDRAGDGFILDIGTGLPVVHSRLIRFRAMPRFTAVSMFPDAASDHCSSAGGQITWRPPSLAPRRFLYRILAFVHARVHCPMMR